MIAGGILLKTAVSEAVIVPQMGANCVLLSINGADILRTPSDYEGLASAPFIYGIPILFPPNRISGAEFTFAGRVYRFPLNEPKRGNHLHGVLGYTPFELVRRESDADEDFAELAYSADADNPYLLFPHAFTVKRAWRLTRDALYQRLEVVNDSPDEMPVGVGFHTALNICFDPRDKNADNYRLKMSASEEIIVNRDTIIPTGERRADSDMLKALNSEGIAPQGTPVSCHMTRRRGGAQLVHTPSGRSVSFSVSDALPYWMLWNGDGHSGFICPEPQSWMVDAPNQSLDTAKSGFRTIAPGKRFTAETCLKLVDAAISNYTA